MEPGLLTRAWEVGRTEKGKGLRANGGCLLDFGSSLNGILSFPPFLLPTFLASLFEETPGVRLM